MTILLEPAHEIWFSHSFATETDCGADVVEAVRAEQPRAQGRGGLGLADQPQKVLYNRVYRRTTFGIEDLFKTRSRRSSAGCLVVLLVVLTLVVIAGACLASYSGDGQANSGTAFVSTSVFTRFEGKQQLGPRIPC